MDFQRVSEALKGSFRELKRVSVALPGIRRGVRGLSLAFQEVLKIFSEFQRRIGAFQIILGAL